MDIRQTRTHWENGVEIVARIVEPIRSAYALADGSIIVQPHQWLSSARTYSRQEASGWANNDDHPDRSLFASILHID